MRRRLCACVASAAMAIAIAIVSPTPALAEIDLFDGQTLIFQEYSSGFKPTGDRSKVFKLERFGWINGRFYDYSSNPDKFDSEIRVYNEAFTSPLGLTLSTSKYYSFGIQTYTYGVANSFLHKGDRVRFVWYSFPILLWSNGSTGITWTSQSVIGTSVVLKGLYGDNVYDLTVGSDGVITIPANLTYVFVGFKLSSVGTNNASAMSINTPHLYLLDEVSETIEKETRKQTDSLMDTSGSDGIAGSAQSVGNQIQSKLGFVGTLIGIPKTFFEGLSADSDSHLSFPGVKYLDKEIVPAVDIDVWEYFPGLQAPVRSVCTMVCVLLFFKGIRRLYLLVFAPDEVSTDDEV